MAPIISPSPPNNDAGADDDMAVNPDNAGGKTLKGTVAAVLIVAGASLVLVPLGLLPDTATLEDHPSKLITFYGGAYWFGILFCVVGLSVLVGLLVNVDAVVAGKVKVFGHELPLKIGGTALLIPALLVGAWFVTDQLNLAGIGDEYGLVSAYEEAVDRADTAEDARNGAVNERDIYHQILTGQLENQDGIDLLRIEIRCPGLDEPLPISWEQPEERRRVVTSRIVDPADTSVLRSVRLQMSDHITFGLRTGDGRSLVDTSFSYSLKERAIIATLSLPSSASSQSRRHPVTLQQFCLDVADTRSAGSDEEYESIVDE